MKTFEVYAIRKGPNGITYGATDYNAKPGYSNECMILDGVRVLSDTQETFNYYIL